MKPIGIEIERWSHACWSWLHQCNIPIEVIDVLSFVLPCSICSAHFVQYREKHPVYEPISKWLIDLHNDVNVRTGKSIVSYQDAKTVNESVDRRLVFNQFLFSVVFTLTKGNTHFDTFCRVAFPTVGLSPPPKERQCTTKNVAQFLFEYIRPYGYGSFSEIVVDFVPPWMYPLHGVGLDTDVVVQTPPCSGDMLTYVVQSIVQEEHVSNGTMETIARRVNSKDLTVRIHHFCPSLPTIVYKTIPLTLSQNTSVEGITKDIVEYMQVVNYIPVVLCTMIGILALIVCIRFPGHRYGTPLIILLCLCVGIYGTMSSIPVGATTITLSILLCLYMSLRRGPLTF